MLNKKEAIYLLLQVANELECRGIEPASDTEKLRVLAHQLEEQEYPTLYSNVAGEQESTMAEINPNEDDRHYKMSEEVENLIEHLTEKGDAKGIKIVVRVVESVNTLFSELFELHNKIVEGIKAERTKEEDKK